MTSQHVGTSILLGQLLRSSINCRWCLYIPMTCAITYMQMVIYIIRAVQGIPHALRRWRGFNKVRTKLVGSREPALERDALKISPCTVCHTLEMFCHSSVKELRSGIEY